MIRTLLWIIGGVLVGLAVHLVVILVLPNFTEDTIWDRISARGGIGEVVVLDHPGDGEANTLGLDPALTYAVCRFDLSRGPGVFNGTLPLDFWSLGVFDQSGVALYGTSNRSGVGPALALGIFNPEQMRLLAQQQFEIEQGLLIVEAPADEVFAVVRLAPPHPAMRERYSQMLSGLECGHIDVPEN